MLAVDPVKRISVSNIIQSPFFKQDLPRYLSPFSVPSVPFLGQLSNLASSEKFLDFEMIDGLGRMEESVVVQLAGVLGVDKEEVWDALRKDDGPHANSVKVAYAMLRDKNRLGKNCMAYIHLKADVFAFAYTRSQWQTTRNRREMLSWQP
jgi:carbon catabolite-derepressing protein kinase